MSLVTDIVEKVDQWELDRVSLRERMDTDYSLWRLDNFIEQDGRGVGFRQYTSNDPRTYGRKAVSILAGAAMVIQTVQGNDDRSTRDQDNAVEQFALGCLRQNDERLALNGEIPLRDALFWDLAIRGRTCGRHLLVKDRGRSSPDATRFDPRACSWDYGSDGMLWFCHKTFVSRDQIKDEYGKSKPDTDGTELVSKYDYYDRTHNTVVVPSVMETPIRNRRHGMIQHGRARVPCWNVPSSLQPTVMAPPMSTESAHPSQLGDALVDYGESIYAENRKVWPQYQFMMSIMLELAGRSRKPIFGIRSQSGLRLVEGNPFMDGSEIPLAQDEELIVYDMMKSAPDLANFMTIISGEMQRGGFPVIMFGETPATISGFAMNTLKGGVSDKVLPAVKAGTVALKQITNAWRDHLNTRAFGVLELSGLGQNRKWFSGTFSADDLEDLGELEIELTPQLPEDDAGKMNLAQLARQPGNDGRPLFSDYEIRERFLQVQNSDLSDAAVSQQMAAQNPLVLAQRMTDALAERGDEEGARAWHIQFAMTMKQLEQALIQMGTTLQQVMASFNPGPGPITGGGLNGDGAGFNPQTLPNAGQGIPPPTPGIETPFQTAPNQTPGTPRPGAQNNGL